MPEGTQELRTTGVIVPPDEKMEPAEAKAVYRQCNAVAEFFWLVLLYIS